MTRAATLAGYAVLVVGILACELVARRTGRVATFGRAVRALTSRRPAWVLVLAAWLWLGWHLFVRVRR